VTVLNQYGFPVRFERYSSHPAGKALVETAVGFVGTAVDAAPALFAVEAAP